MSLKLFNSISWGLNFPTSLNSQHLFMICYENSCRKEQEFEAILWRWEWIKDDKNWVCYVFRGRFPAFKLLRQPCSSSCAKRNWITCKFIHSLKRNKMAPTRAEDLIYVHSNLRLLSRRHEKYVYAARKIWDIGGDS